MCENKWERRNTPQSPEMCLKSGQNAGAQDNFVIFWSFAGNLLPTSKYLGCAKTLYISLTELLPTEMTFKIGPTSRHSCSAEIAIAIGMGQEKFTCSEEFCRFWQNLEPSVNGSKCAKIWKF